MNIKKQGNITGMTFMNTRKNIVVSFYLMQHKLIF